MDRAEKVSKATTFQLVTYCGALLVLFNLAAPYNGLMSIPISFFLKNKLNLRVIELAEFNFWTSLPLYASFFFGYLRDRWNPFRAGDRAHLVLFGGVTCCVYGALALVTPTYFMLLIGILVATVSVQIVAGSANALISTAGQQHSMPGQASMIFNIATALPSLAAYLGGWLSEVLERASPESAARSLFLISALLMLGVVGLGALGPRAVLGNARSTVGSVSILDDISTLVRQLPIYPPLIILTLWNFGPAIGAALQYHLANALRASDAQVGAFYAIFFGASIPTLALYGYLCRRVRLSRLLVAGTVFATLQMIPLLFVHTVTGSYLAAAVMGLLGGIATGSYVDLAIRSAPTQLRGTMMMMVVTVIWTAYRVGDLWGAAAYEHHRSLTLIILVSTGAYSLMLPLLLIVPRRLIQTHDGQMLSPSLHV